MIGSAIIVSPPSWLGSGLKRTCPVHWVVGVSRLPTFLAGEWIETIISSFVVHRLSGLPTFLAGEWIETQYLICAGADIQSLPTFLAGEGIETHV